MTLSFSRGLAVFVGVITLAAEVARRRQQFLDPAAIPLWIDDVLIGGFLLYGAWRVAADHSAGRPVLAAAWGFMCGMAYYSFFDQLQRLSESDPSSFGPVWVIAVKAVGLALAILGLVTALITPDRSPNASA